MAKEHYDRKVFYAEIRPLFGKLFQEHVDNINTILDTWEPTPFKDRRCLAYILATTKAETGNMVPKEEIGKGGGRHGEYYGRGYVQLTWKANYERATQELNKRNLIGRQVNLVGHPEEALEPNVAATILIYGMEEGWFTGKKTGDYFNDKGTDWVNARKVVNSLDRATEIAGYAQQFYAALTKAATVDEPEQPPKPEEPAENPTVALLKEQIRAATGVQKVTVILE